MSTFARTGIFIAYHFPEKRWLDRIQTALEPLAGGAPIVVWDDRKLLGGYAWRNELADVLSRSKVAVMIVSDPFLLSGFIQRAKLPSLLDKERERGLRICWVLAGYCLFSVAGLRAEEAGNGINAALDGLNATGRDAKIAEVARKVAQLLALPEPENASAAGAATANGAGESAAAAAAVEGSVAESKPRAKRKRSAPERSEPQILLPLAAEPEPAPAPAFVPPPPQPHLEFPAPKPQTHLEAPPVNALDPVPDVKAEPGTESAAEPVLEREAPPEAKPAVALAPAAIPAPKLVLPQVAPAAPAPEEGAPPARRSESPMLPALDAVIEARQHSIEKFRQLARWLKVAAGAVALLSLPAALWIGLTHFLLIFGFAFFIASLALFLHARIALLGQRIVGMRYTRSGLADELLPNRQREPLLRRAAEFLG